MNKLGVSGMRNWRWGITTFVILTTIAALTFVLTTAPKSIFAQRSSTVTVYIQASDSCMQALSGATFTVTAPNGTKTTTAPTNGTTPKGLPNYNHACPMQQGTCVNFSTGCTSAVLDVPTSGTATYTITVAKTAPGGYGRNASYAICQGGSDCPHGPEVATVKVTFSGTVSATIKNIYPDGTTVTWPTNKSAYSGAQSDPLLYHEFGVASNTNVQCDGDSDKDDYLTGTPGKHCDSDEVSGKHA